MMNNKLMFAALAIPSFLIANTATDQLFESIQSVDRILFDQALTNQADVNHIDAKTGHTPLMEALCVLVPTIDSYYKKCQFLDKLSVLPGIIGFFGGGSLLGRFIDRLCYNRVIVIAAALTGALGGALIAHKTSYNVLEFICAKNTLKKGKDLFDMILLLLNHPSINVTVRNPFTDTDIAQMLTTSLKPQHITYTTIHYGDALPYTTIHNDVRIELDLDSYTMHESFYTDGVAPILKRLLKIVRLHLSTLTKT